MLQVITVTLDLDKIIESGIIIMRVISPRADLPNGTVLIHDPLSLLGFKMKVTEEAPTISVMSNVVNAPMPKPALPQSADPTVPSAPPAPANVTPGFFGKHKNKKK